MRGYDAVAIFEGLRLPVVAAPMFLISGPGLVVAGGKSGIVGSSTTDVAARWKDRWAAGSRRSTRPWRNGCPARGNAQRNCNFHPRTSERAA